jgi:muramoyltetrapeptide carboxypeptidase
MVLTPTPLKVGDLLIAISPSGRLKEQADLEKGLMVWRDRGYRVELADQATAGWGYLAGEDGVRRQQLASAWHNPDCKGILCVRGGYGGMRLLEDWHWSGNGGCKWLIGFSDITALLWSMECNHIGGGIHGPLLTTIAQEPSWSIDRLFSLLQGQPLPSLKGTGWIGGSATGILLPCNLTVATHLLGTPLEPNLAGAILAIEDITEAPYRIDRLLTQWRLCGKLQQLAGIAIGRFSQCDPPTGVASFTAAEVLRDRLGDLGIPIVADLPFGHDGCNAALPVGAMARLDGDRGELLIIPPTNKQR